METKSWRIELFGGLRCSRGDVVIERFRTRKAASLLAYLCLHADRTHPREELLELFWPDMEPEAARNNLRQALHWLRHELEKHTGDCLLIADYDTVRLTPGSVRTDVQEFHALLKDSDSIESLRGAVEQYRGELLAGFYEDWVFPERERLDTLFRNTLLKLQRSLAEEGRCDQALPYALTAVQLDPLSEDSHLAVMRLQSALGDPGAVQQQFNRFAILLNEQLGEIPSDEARQELSRLLLDARSNQPAVHPAVDNASMPASILGIGWRELALGAAFAAVLVVVLIILGRPQRTHASASSFEQPMDRQIADLHSLRLASALVGPGREPTRRRHAQLCINLGEQAWMCWYGRGEEAWLKRLTESHEDIRIALRWLLEHDPERAVQLCGALTRFWYVRGFQREGDQWLSEALSRASPSDSSYRARALVGSAFLSKVYDAAALEKCRKALEIYRKNGDRWGAAHALRHIGFLSAYKAEFDIARHAYDRALAIFKELGDDRGQAVTLLCISFVPDQGGNSSPSRVASRRACGNESLKLFKMLDNQWGVTMALLSLVDVARDNREREHLLREALASESDANGLSFRENTEQARLTASQGDIPKARRFMSRALLIARDQGDQYGIAQSLVWYVHYMKAEPAGAARLFGAAISMNRSLGVRLGHRLDPNRDELIAALGRQRFEQLASAGSRLSAEQAIDEVVRLN